MKRKRIRQLSLCSALLVLALSSSHHIQAIETEPVAIPKRKEN